MNDETLAQYKRHLRAHVVKGRLNGRLNGSGKFIDLDIETFERMNEGLSRSTANNTLCGIKWLLRNRYGLENHEHELLTYNVERKHKKVPKYFTEEQFNKAIAKFDEGKPIDVRDRALVMLSVCCGLRLSEAAAVRVDHVDVERSLLFIPARKGGLECESKISSGALEAIRAWLSARAEFGTDHDRLWLNMHTSEALTTDGIRAFYEKRFSDLIGKKITSHMCRHSMVFIMRMQGMSDDWIMAQGGWNDYKTFKMHYDSMKSAMIDDDDLPFGGGR